MYGDCSCSQYIENNNQWVRHLHSFQWLDVIAVKLQELTVLWILCKHVINSTYFIRVGFLSTFLATMTLKCALKHRPGVFYKAIWRGCDDIMGSRYVPRNAWIPVSRPALLVKSTERGQGKDGQISAERLGFGRERRNTFVSIMWQYNWWTQQLKEHFKVTASDGGQNA